MGYLSPSYKKAIIDEFVSSISSNTSQYYVFGANPVPYPGATPPVPTNDYGDVFITNWTMLFGKKLNANNFQPVVNNTIWSSNTVYTMYDDTSDTLSNTAFYVYVNPIPGGFYNVYKCINNANNSPSTQIPDQVQQASFTKSDGYTWRYITTIQNSDYVTYSTSNSAPIYANSTVVATANQYAGIEVVMIANAGTGYAAYHDGIVLAVANSTLVQIAANASFNNDFYTKSAIYFHNVSPTAQLMNITKYVSNTSGNWVFIDSVANTTNIVPGITQYKISPRVLFHTDGSVQPQAYSVVNTVAASIANVVIIETGRNVSWANVSIVSNTSYGTGANLYAIAPPPGGHGFDPETELYVTGYSLVFDFANSESNTIVAANIIYNKIGIIKNPYVLNANTSKGVQFYGNTYSSILKGNTTVQFTPGDTVIGGTSNSLAIVVFSNSSVVYLTGDKTFVNTEIITSSNGSLFSNLVINTIGDIYTKDLKPLYLQNIDNVQRANNQTESYKIVIKV